MITIFALLLQATGLSQAEAATFLKVRLDTVKSWSAGRNACPDRVLSELTVLADRIDEAADQVIAQIDKMDTAPDLIELGLASDDTEARLIGWPCVGAHRACLALVVVRGMAAAYRFKIVPRGSTVATAAAAIDQ